MKMQIEEEKILLRKRKSLIKLETNQRKSTSIMIIVISMYKESLKENFNNFNRKWLLKMYNRIMKANSKNNKLSKMFKALTNYKKFFYTWDSYQGISLSLMLLINNCAKICGLSCREKKDKVFPGKL